MVQASEKKTAKAKSLSADAIRQRNYRETLDNDRKAAIWDKIALQHRKDRSDLHEQKKTEIRDENARQQRLHRSEAKVSIFYAGFFNTDSFDENDVVIYDPHAISETCPFCKAKLFPRYAFVANLE